MKLFSRHHIQNGWEIITIALGISAVVIGTSATGIFQRLELLVLDQFFQFQPDPAVDESRILVVTIDEADINLLQEWPISDGHLADLIQTIDQHQPRAIGLDIYRNIPVEPGHADLVEVFRNTPRLIGIEKVIGEPPIEPPPELQVLEQVGMSDLIVDSDGRVRRGLMSLLTPEGQVKYGLGAQAALMYLADESLFPEPIDNKSQRLRLGRAIFDRMESNDGGYVKADSGGYQMMISYQGGQASFDTVSFSEVLQGKLTSDLVKDKVVFIGSTAPSLKDLFLTPKSPTEFSPGVYIHAHITNQIISAALDGQNLLKGASVTIQWLWLALWAHVSTALIFTLTREHPFSYKRKWLKLLWLVLSLNISLVGIGFSLFLAGWWLPIVAPLTVTSLAGVTTLMRHNQKLHQLASLDGLTLLANRRSFDQCLQQVLHRQTVCALVLCDIDFFKPYNDTYGHQAGDRCLQQVAKVLQQGVRKGGFAARYGGEEFAIILPGTPVESALEIVQTIQNQIALLQIPHRGSKVNEYVTLSYGLAGTEDNFGMTSSMLIHKADQALYKAKEQGRNQAALD